MLGIVVIDKALEWTSHDVVGKMRRIFNTKRIGHAGTLDPLATGVLVVAVGPATRFLQYLPLEPKIYQAEITFGRSTTTYDLEGETDFEGPVPEDLRGALLGILGEYVGQLEQLPPMYSAVKVKGKPLYDYARKGQEVERKSRSVFIERIEVLGLEGPVLKLEVECSGGTYIRTLAHDLGMALGCGAHLSGLVRTGVGKFLIDRAVGIEDVSAEHLIPLGEALEPMPSRVLTEAELTLVQNGGFIPRGGAESDFVTLKARDGSVVAMASVHGNELRPECVIPIGSE